MDSILIIAIIVLAIGLVVANIYGRKKNEWISSWIASESESVLNPVDKNYVNIGGSIGYNFTYKLKKPYTEAKGTFTLLPRQSLLYIPISLLIRGYDRFYLNIFTKEELLGEGHIISKDYYGKMRTKIDGINDMYKEVVIKDGIEFILLWRNHRLEKPLKDLLEKVETTNLFKHFCSFKDNKTFFILMKAKKEKVETILKTVMNNIDNFIAKKESSVEKQQ